MSLPNTPSASSASSPTPPPPSLPPSLTIRTPSLPLPTNARGTPRRPPKLRSSCDACGAAKVRCDKTQPRCGRCAAGGLTCVYGLSRKFGKAPRKKPPVDSNGSGETLPRPLAQNAQHMPRCPDLRQYSDPSCSIKYEGASASNFGLNDLSMAMSSYANHDLFMRSATTLEDVLEDHFGGFSDSNYGLGSDPRGTVDPLDLTFPSSDFQTFADWIHPDDLMHTPESQEADSAPTPAPTESRPLFDAALFTSESHNCHRLAYSTLESLSFRQESLTSDQHLTQTMDKVLNRNKQAVNNLHELLKCPCSKSPHLAMLYASITSKILMWYQLAAGCTKPTTSWDYFSSTMGSNPTPPLSASSSPSMAFVQPTSPIGQPSFVVTPMQFSVGAFSVDDESAQEALRKQLLLSELKKAGNLIDILSIHGREELAAGEVNDIYSALGTWLKCELNRTVSTLKTNA